MREEGKSDTCQCGHSRGAHKRDGSACYGGNLGSCMCGVFCLHPDDRELDSLRSALSKSEGLLKEAERELDALRERFLRGPMTLAEVKAALHAGRAEAMAATGDNAWASLLKQRDSALTERDSLREENARLVKNGPLWLQHAIAKMHSMVDQTDPSDAIGSALTRAGLERWSCSPDDAFTKPAAQEVIELQNENARLMALVGSGMEEMERMRRDRDSYANSDFERQLDEARKECDVLRSFVNDIAEEDCSYCDECPSSARHYRCLRCKAVKALDRAATTKPEAGKECK